MSKGDDTRAMILEAGMSAAAAEGLESISIGGLAERVGMSKSGLFAHFRSKEALQLAVLQHGRQAFAEMVVGPALGRPRGVARLRDLFHRWLRWSASPVARSGCLFLQAAAEYDDREGPVRERVVQFHRELIQFLVRSTQLCIDEGEFRSDVDSEQFAFELFALVMANHFHTRLLRDLGTPERTLAAFERLIASAR